MSEISRKTPTHVAIIMDGNGRWAVSQGLPRVDGHRAGGKVVKTIVEAAVKAEIKYLTLFSFSTENWNRSETEVSTIMGLFKEYLDKELRTLLEHGICLKAVGDIEGLPGPVKESLLRNIELSKDNTRLTLVLALNYGGREEIVHSIRSIAEKVKSGELHPDEIDKKLVSDSLWSVGIPDPDLLIRTSGEMRISNFLLWQLAYSEIIVANECWPDFNEAVFNRCLEDFSKRERRFGFTSEQIARGEHKEVAKNLGYSH